MDIQNQSFISSILIIMIPFITIAVVGMIISRKLFNHPLLLNTELRALSTVSSVTGGLFGLIMGLIVVSLWQDYKGMQAKTIEEAAYIGVLHAEAEQLNGNTSDSIQLLTKTYVESIITEGWPLMTEGKESKNTGASLAKLAIFVMKVEESGGGKDDVKKDLMDKLTKLAFLRKERLFYASTPRVPPNMWVVLIVGAAITIFSTFLFPISELKTQLLLTSLHSGMIGLVLFLIVCLNYPFRGAISIDPEPYEITLKHINGFKKIEEKIPNK